MGETRVIPQSAEACRVQLLEANWVAQALAAAGFTVVPLGQQRFTVADGRVEGEISLTADSAEHSTVTLDWSSKEDAAAQLRLVLEPLDGDRTSVSLDHSDDSSPAAPLARCAAALVAAFQADKEDAAEAPRTDPLIWLVAFGVLLLALLLSI